MILDRIFKHHLIISLCTQSNFIIDQINLPCFNENNILFILITDHQYDNYYFNLFCGQPKISANLNISQNNI